MARVSCCASARPPPSPLFPYTTLFRSEFLPAAVLHPSADRRVSEEQFDLSEILERDRGRVDAEELDLEAVLRQQDRKSTRLNSSHRCTSYAVFCLKKKTTRPASSTRAH